MDKKRESSEKSRLESLLEGSTKRWSKRLKADAGDAEIAVIKLDFLYARIPIFTLVHKIAIFVDRCRIK